MLPASWRDVAEMQRRLATCRNVGGAPRWRAGDMRAFSCRSIFSSSGSAKAAVLPVPVCAAPITSRPSSTIGIALAWIGVIAV